MLATIAALGWPTMLEQFFQTAVQYIDTAMVGSLGTHATAAVGCTGTVNWLIGGLVSSMGIGFLAMISQSIGARKPERARAAAAQSLSVTLITGLALTALIQALAGFVPGWMRADPLIREDAAMYFRILHATILLRALSIIPATVLRAAGETGVLLCPGNYGEDFSRNELGLSIEKHVSVSNFIGDAIEAAVSDGFKRILLVGHIGKLVKLAGGIMNTHSRWADCRTDAGTFLSQSCRSACSSFASLSESIA